MHDMALLRSLTWSELLPSLRVSGLVVLLFAAALLVAREAAGPVRELLSAHAVLGIVIFVVLSAVAVLMPLATNLPLVPLVALAWGSGWTAVLLLLGWLLGAAASFMLGRYARPFVLARLPAVQRHAQIDRLIDPRRRLLSLTLLRMTFPVDVLSYALGLFSPRTTAVQNLLSTALGAAPFAVLFAYFPQLSTAAQLVVFVLTLLAFVLYVSWVLRRTRPDPTSS